MICTEPDLSQQTFRSPRPRLIPLSSSRLVVLYCCVVGLGVRFLWCIKDLQIKSPTHLHLTCRLPEGGLFGALPIECWRLKTWMCQSSSCTRSEPIIMQMASLCAISEGIQQNIRWDFDFLFDLLQISYLVLWPVYRETNTVLIFFKPDPANTNTLCLFPIASVGWKDSFCTEINFFDSEGGFWTATSDR
jgi:hypothetical protein